MTVGLARLADLARLTFAALLLCAAACRPELPPDAAPTGASQEPLEESLVVLPDDGADAVVSRFATARRAIDVDAYWLSDARVVNGLLAAIARGVRVRAVLEPSPYGAPDANQAAYAALSGAGADVRWAQRPKGFDHAKSWRVDEDEVFVSSANLTASGLERNREFVLRRRDPKAAERWEAVFAADLAGTDDATLASRLGADEGAAASSVAPGLVISPLDTRRTLTALAREARRRLVIETELFDDPTLANTLAALAHAAVRVEVMVSAEDAIPAVQAEMLRAAGITLAVVRTHYLHAKAMLVDDRSYAVGSPNLTASSWDVNREIAQVGQRPTVAARLAQILEADLAAAVALSPDR